MDITFENRRIQKLCSDEREGIRRLGAHCARKLRARMTDLEAVGCLQDLRRVPGKGRLHELTGNRKGQLAMDLAHPYRLLMVPAEEPPPRREDGGLDWARITAVRIVEIVDYH